MQCQSFDFDFLLKLQRISLSQNEPGNEPGALASKRRRKPKVSTNHATGILGRDKGKSVKRSTSEDPKDSRDDDDDDKNDDDYDGWKDEHDIMLRSSPASGPSARTRSRAKVNSASNGRQGTQPGSLVLVISSDSEG
jgi:hypothetical protein